MNIRTKTATTIRSIAIAIPSLRPCQMSVMFHHTPFTREIWLPCHLRQSYFLERRASPVPVVLVFERMKRRHDCSIDLKVLVSSVRRIDACRKKRHLLIDKRKGTLQSSRLLQEDLPIPRRDPRRPLHLDNRPYRQ